MRANRRRSSQHWVRCDSSVLVLPPNGFLISLMWLLVTTCLPVLSDIAPPGCGGVHLGGGAPRCLGAVAAHAPPAVAVETCQESVRHEKALCLHPRHPAAVVGLPAARRHMRFAASVAKGCHGSGAPLWQVLVAVAHSGLFRFGGS